ncbi:MAG: FprA family A-type flavoprotein [Clostridia bacterium]|nr:FprA family A-type flavoprotein [Clostridia bacterium]
MEIKNNVYYVGLLDKELNVFDVNMKLKYGTSYNSYLIKGQKYTALVDTVKDEFAEQYIKNIEEYINIKDINYLIVNHSEPDHAGSIEKILKMNPDIEVCGTKMAIEFVRNILNFDFKSNVLTANDSIELGEKELKFFPFPMLHWPDSMYTYLKEDKMLFTCDSFGVHYASEKMYNDLEKDITEEYKYYFDNILGPFKDPFLLNALKKIALIPIEYICPGHGLIIRKNPEKYIEMYRKWCEEIEYPQSKVTICYISSYGYTKKIAKALVEGLNRCNVIVKEYDLQSDNLEEAKKDLATSQGVMIGSPTILSDSLPQVYEVMSVLNPINNKGMSALAFGSYAWSGEAPLNINQCFRMLRFNTPFEPIRIKLNPSEYDLEQIRNIGEEFAKNIIKD